MGPATAILGTGLVTAVGYDARASCAAIRAKVKNPVQTAFLRTSGEWITANRIPADTQGGLRRAYVEWAGAAVLEALKALPVGARPVRVPLLLCLAERDRVWRPYGAGEDVLRDVEELSGLPRHPASVVVERGRVALGVALVRARALLASPSVDAVLVAAVDSLVSGPLLAHFDAQDRLLDKRNADGFIAGEAAGAMLVVAGHAGSGGTTCVGVGFGVEQATIGAGRPLRGDGLSLAVEGALLEAGCGMHDIDFRVSDLSGEQYYFKEAALALARTLRQRRPQFDLWHPAECVGEVGAAAGAVAIAVAKAAFDKGYAPGASALIHLANDAGERCAIVVKAEPK